MCVCVCVINNLFTYTVNLEIFVLRIILLYTASLIWKLSVDTQGPTPKQATLASKTAL